MPPRQAQHTLGIHIALANEQSAHAVDEAMLLAAAAAVLRDSVYRSASISLAVVDDTTMHELNRQFLEHDYPTDVLSFVLDDDDCHLEGEIIISADTAAMEAADHGWSPAAEQLLYVIHGTLHLIGYRDKEPEEREEIRAAEARYLRQFKLTQPFVGNEAQRGPETHLPGPGATSR